MYSISVHNAVLLNAQESQQPQAGSISTSELPQAVGSTGIPTRPHANRPRALPTRCSCKQMKVKLCRHRTGSCLWICVTLICALPRNTDASESLPSKGRHSDFCFDFAFDFWPCDQDLSGSPTVWFLGSLLLSWVGKIPWQLSPHADLGPQTEWPTERLRSVLNTRFRCKSL